MKMKAIQQSEKFWDKRSKKYGDQIKKHKAIYEKMFDSTKSLLTHS